MVFSVAMIAVVVVVVVVDWSDVLGFGGSGGGWERSAGREVEKSRASRLYLTSERTRKCERGMDGSLI